MPKLKSFSFAVLFFFALSNLAWSAEEKVEAPHDFTGTWKVLLSNSLSRRQITFHIEQKDGRLRGKMVAKGMPEQKIDGRFEEEDGILLWGTYYDRSGASIDYDFKGTIEGEPGKESFKGKTRFFGKRYDFVGVRAPKKKKKKKKSR